MKSSIFKAYDIRGVYPTEINEDIVVKISKALARYFKKGTIIVGHDARLSSPSLHKVVLKNLTTNYKLQVIDIGLVTTPMLYFLVNHFKSVGGIMITASHNPKNYNGLKVVGAKARPISGKEISELID
ncbi:MAG: hypothetical protein Q8Q37_02025 [bacterium]|nr:hypothetical protein [bacterium]